MRVRHLHSAFRLLVAAVLSLLMCGQSVAQSVMPAGGKASPLKTDERELHVLSRFTFGPTAVDMAAIHTMGVDAWFEQQLHPDRLGTTLGDQKLAARLADFPALQLPVDRLLARFPSNAETRQAARGELAIPDDPELAAIYRRHIAKYELKEEKKAQSQPAEATIAEASSVGKRAEPGEAMSSGTPNKDGMLKPSTAPETMSSASAAAGQPAVGVKLGDAAPATYPEAQLRAVLALPSGERVSRILAMEPAEYESFRTSLKPATRIQLNADLSPEQKEMLADYEAPTRAVVEELQSQRLLRDIYSSHQLQEVMTTFWLNHFNVFLHKNDETPYYLVSYERDVIRPRALGNFEDLLVATAESPAMLLYLDNASSTGPDSAVSERQRERAAHGKSAKATPPGLNENYARELMELHTLGVNGGYTQKDVTEVAKIFSGWTVERPQRGGGFKFDPSRHQPGAKSVLGTTFKEDGQQEGLSFLHLLANRPATAHFIAKQLATTFVNDEPSKALVDAMARTFVRTHGDIPAVLRTMLHSHDFWSRGTYRAKVKTPLEFVVSAARTSGAEIGSSQPLLNALKQMGMPLYGCVPPTGWSEKADAWVSTGALVARLNFGLSFAANRYAGVQTNWSEGSGSAVASARAGAAAARDVSVEEHRLEARLVPAGISEKSRGSILAGLQSSLDQADGRVLHGSQKGGSQVDHGGADDTLAGLLLGSPEFQRK